MTKKKDDKELLETLQRLQAEFENYKKRTDSENENRVKSANAGLIVKLLPVLDNFELAMKNECADEHFRKGMVMLQDMMMKVLKEEGLQKIDCVGNAFDPHMHEAMLQEESDKDKGTVLEELQSGYALNGKVIRHAKVKVAK